MAVVPRPLRRRPGTEAATRTALSALVASPKFELVPLKNALAQAAFLPPGALVSVTASPAKGMDATIELGSRLRERGYVVVPHLSAHMIRDRAHLAELLGRMRDAGIDRAFVVGGDAMTPASSVTGCRPGDGRHRSPPARDRVPSYLQAIRRCGRGAPGRSHREGAVRRLHNDPDVLRRDRREFVAPGAPG
jgi:hypothetical protein